MMDKSFEMKETAQPKKVTFRAKTLRGYQEVGGVRFLHAKVPGYGTFETPYYVSEKLYDQIISSFSHYFFDGHISAGRAAPEDHSVRFALRAREDVAVTPPVKKAATGSKRARRARQAGDGDHVKHVAKKVPEPIEHANGTKTIFDAAQLEDGVEI